MQTGFKDREIRQPSGLRRLLAAGMAAFILVLACAGCQSDPRAASRAYLASGKKYIAQRNFSAAAIEFRNALQQDPRDWQAQYELARVENQMHQWRRCYHDLRAVVSEQPSFAPARLDLAELYIAAAQSDRAQRQIDRVRQLSPRNVRAELVQMKLYLTQGSLGRAAKQCGTIRSLAPHDDRVYALCGLAAVGQKQYATAQQYFQHALQLAPGSAESYRNLSNVLDLEGKTAEAEGLVASGIRNHPKSLDLELLLADLYVRHGRIEDADRLFKTLRARQSQFPDLLVTLGNFWMWRNELPRAIADYQAAEAAHPSELVEKNLASAYLTLHHIGQAQRFTSAVLRRNPQSADSLALEGAIDYLKGDYSQAGQLLQSARKDNPGSILPNFYLGMTWLATGQLDRAKQAFGECIQENGKFVQAYARLGQIALDTNDWRLGAAYAQKVLAINPGSVNGYLLLAQADMMKNDMPAAGRVIAVALKAPQPPRAIEQVAIRYDILRKDFARADRQFAHLESVSARPYPLLAWYADQLASAGDVSRAIPQVRSWMAQSPPNPSADELLARLYFVEGNLAQAESSVRLSLALAGKRATALQLLGEILERRGKPEEAAKEYTSAINADPADIRSYLLAGELRMRQGQYAEAQPYFESARTHAPQSDAAKLALARCWAAQDTHLNRALGFSQELKAKFPHNPSVADTLGWIYHERGVNSLALPQLEMAAQAVPLDAVTKFHLGMTLLSANEKVRARRVLDSSLRIGLPPSEQAAAQKALLATGDGKTR